jgi:3-methyladenine DNA glycosylase AlkD
MTTKAERVREALTWLERAGNKKTREEMSTRYGIHTPKAYGVSIGKIQQLGKRIGTDHELAAALWATGWYEARTLCAFIDDAARVTSVQMDRWARDFDNWGICDTVCFKLFDRVPHAWKKIEPWCKRRDEFVRRAGFVMIACLALHDKQASDDQFLPTLTLIERGASDERNFVKKGVSWALRSVGRRSKELRAESLAVASRLAESSEPAAKWVGKDALRDLGRPAKKK